MEYSIFYSWQSDLPNNTNRSFIEKALNNAAAVLSKDDNFTITAVIDRNTDGLPGSPSIAHSISDKIAKCDLFVCDVSIINSETNKERPTPNPNILFELGYASSVLGWDRIIIVQNIAFGGPEVLPFDLRGRSISGYFLNEESDKPETRKDLETRLLKRFQEAFEHHARVGKYNHLRPFWWGMWTLKTRRTGHAGFLYIHQVSSTSFVFSLGLADGARSGELEGEATIVAPNAAVAKINVYKDKPCEIVFRRILRNDYWIIELEEGRECSGFHGAGTSFRGIYEHEVAPILYYGYNSEVEMNLLSSVSGKFCMPFLERFQGISTKEIKDNFITKVVSGGCKGLYTIMEGIIATNDKGQIWCAYIDGEVVRYFTNVMEWRDKLPATFDLWRENFAGKPIVFPGTEEMQNVPITSFEEARSKRFGQMKELFLKPDKKWWQFWKKK